MQQQQGPVGVLEADEGGIALRGADDEEEEGMARETKIRVPLEPFHGNMRHLTLTYRLNLLHVHLT